MSKLDLIIPTYNRIEYLKRILDYYQEYGKDFNFIVADSSNPVNKTKNKKLIRSYSNLNILYIDKFSQNLVQSIKFAHMVKYAKSKYVCFCADDDFIIPNAIRKCINFLEKNSDYVAAHGTYIGFYLHINILMSNKFWWNFRSSPNTISSSKPIDRLTSLLTNSHQVLWSVRRTNITQACYKQFLKYKIDPLLLPILGELIPDALTAIYGKVKSLNILYAARQYFESIISYYPNLPDAKHIGIFDREYHKFKACLLDNMAKQDNISKNRSSEIIDKAMEEVIKNSNQQYLMNKIYLALRYLPKVVLKKINSLHAHYLFSKPKKGNIGLIDLPSSKYFNDFSNIRQCVRNYKSL